MKVPSHNGTSMKLFILIITLFFISSCEDYNSNSADKIKYSNQPQAEEGGNGGDPNFAPAFAVIQNRCVSCHSGFHNNWATYTSNEKWLNSGLIHRGDPDNSTLIKRTINSGQAGANMPLGFGAIPDAEFETLRTWITNIP